MAADDEGGKKPRRYRRWVLAFAGVLVGAVLAGLVPVNVGFLKDFIEGLVYDKTRLELSLEGPVIVRLGPAPSVKTGSISLASGGEPVFVEVDEAFARVRLGKLFRKKIHAKEVRAAGVRLDYCARLNPETQGQGGGVDPGLLEADHVEIRDAAVFCSERDDWPRLRLAELVGELRAAESGSLAGKGDLEGLPVKLDATVGGVDKILAKEDFPIDLIVEADTLIINAKGDLVDLGDKPAVEFETVAWSEELGALITRLIKTELPRLGELDAETWLRAEGGRVEFARLAGSLGSSRFDSLDASIVTGGERPGITLRGAADVLDVGQFMPEAGGNSGNSGDVDLGKLVEMLARLDADAEVTVNQVTGLPLAMTDIDLDATLADRLLAIDNLSFSSSGTTLQATGSFDGANDCPALDMSASFAAFDVQVLSDIVSLPAALAAEAKTVSVEASSCGYLLSEHLASLLATVTASDGVVGSGDTVPPVVIDNARIRLKPDERSRFSGSGRIEGERVRLDVAAGSLPQLLGSERWPVDVDASGAGARIALRGRAALTEAGPTTSSKLTVFAERSGTLSNILPVAPESELPVSFEARLSLDEASLAARDIEFSVGESIVRGNAAWKHSAEPQFVELELRSPIVHLDRIAAALQTSGGGEAKVDNNERRELSFPSVDLDLRVDQVTSNYASLEHFSLAGRIRGDLIDNARVSAIVEGDLALEGTLDVDLRQLPATAAAEVSATNVQIGRLLGKLGVADHLDMRADALEINMSTSGSMLEEFLVNASLTTVFTSFEWLIPKGLPGEEMSGRYEIQLADVRIDSAPGARTIARSQGRVEGIDVGLRLNLPSLDEAFGDNPELPVRIAAFADRSVMVVDAAIDRSVGSEFRARVELSGSVFDVIPAASEITPPLPDYQLSGNLVIADRHILVPDIEFTVGDSSMTGSLSIYPVDRPQVDLELVSPILQTEDLQYFIRQVQAIQKARQEVMDVEIVADERDETARSGSLDRAYAIKEGILPRITDAISKVKARADIDVGLSVEDLRAGDAPLGSAELKLRADERAFSLSPLTIRLPGDSGDVDVEYVWTEEDGFLDMNFDAQASGLSYGGLLRMVNPESEIEGVLYLDTKLSAAARRDPNLSALSQLLDNANGYIEFATWPQNIESGALDLWTANLIFALLPIAGSDSRLNCLVTRFDSKDGLMKAKTALLDTTTTIIRARGTLNFAEDTVNLLITPQAKREKLFSASTPVKVTGPVADLQVGVEPIGFFGTLVKWYTFYIYVPFKWLTGKRFPEDGTETCYDAMGWELTPELREYYLERDFTSPPPAHEE